MLISIVETAEILGVSERRLVMTINHGFLSAVRVGNARYLHKRHVLALAQMDITGRRWGEVTWAAALDIFSRASATLVGRPQRNRLQARLRDMSEAELAGRVLAGRVRLFRADASQQRVIGSETACELGLTGTGTTVLVEEDLDTKVRELGLTQDPEGNVVAVQTSPAHRAVIEALVLIAYGSSREENAGRMWIAQRLQQLFGS